MDAAASPGGRKNTAEETLMGMIFERKLPIPQMVKELYPLSDELAQVVAERNEELKAIFSGKSDKFVLKIGRAHV